jgi:hypothetical protein
VQETRLIIVHAIVKPAVAADGSATAIVQRTLLEASDPQIPPCGRIGKLKSFVGAPVPTKVDPDFTEPPEAHYSENGVRAQALSPDVVALGLINTSLNRIARALSKACERGIPNQRRLEQAQPGLLGNARRARPRE